MSKAVRAAMLKASIGNVKACLSLDEGCGAHWTSAPVADVHNVLDELARLQVVEERIKDRIREKETRRADALETARKYRDQWQVEYAHDFENAARQHREEIDLLEEMLDG